MTDQVRHKTFISYYHDDQEEVDKFIETFQVDPIIRTAVRLK